jgi:hypothetical protein
LPAFPQVHSDHHNNNALLQNFIGKPKALITKLIDVEKTRRISEGSLFSLRFETSSCTLGVSHPFPQRARFAKPFPFHQKRVKYVSGNSPEVYE